MLNRTLIVLVIVASLLLSGCHINGCNQTSEHKHLLTQMYQYFETLRAKPLRRADMARFYDPKVIMIINGQKVAQGRDEFYQHFKMMLAKTKHFKFIFPRHAMIAEENRIAAQYNILLQVSGKPKLLHVIAIFTFKKGKILSWDEVVSSNSASTLKLKRHDQ